MILNLTSRKTTPLQQQAGVVDVGTDDFELLQKAWEWGMPEYDKPSDVEIQFRCGTIVGIALKNIDAVQHDHFAERRVMIESNHHLLEPLIKRLQECRLFPLFGCSIEDMENDV